MDVNNNEKYGETKGQKMGSKPEKTLLI